MVLQETGLKRVIASFKREGKKKPGNYKADSKILYQVIKQSIQMNFEDSKEVSNSQDGFIKNKSHHTNQNSFYGEMTVFCYRNKQ